MHESQRLTQNERDIEVYKYVPGGQAKLVSFAHTGLGCTINKGVLYFEVNRLRRGVSTVEVNRTQRDQVKAISHNTTLNQAPGAASEEVSLATLTQLEKKRSATVRTTAV